MSDAGSVREQLRNQSQRLRILRAMQQTIRSYEVFDEEDLEFLDDAIDHESKIDEELLALQDRLPVRQRILTEMDDQWQISKRFPELMTRFAEKDAELYALMQEKQRAQRAYRK
jgi:hypothetical protein